MDPVMIAAALIAVSVFVLGYQLSVLRDTIRSAAESISDAIRGPKP